MSNEELISLHNKCSDHRKEIESSDLCGCFFCKSLFSPLEIKDWIDGHSTALCPKCGIDSVLPNMAKDEKHILSNMRKYWFW